jgi:hypothetical protein
MSREFDRLLLFASMLIPIGFALWVWLDRRSSFPRWAKVMSLVGCLAGIGWDIITLLQPPLSMNRYPFLLAVSVKQVLVGIFIGIAITIAIACPYRKPDESHQNSDASI